MQLNPDTGEPLADAEPIQRGYGLHWRRRTRSGLAKEDPIPLHRDEMLPRNTCIAGLRKLWFHLPRGAKRPLARELNISIEHLRGIVRLRGGLPEADRRRLSRFLMEYARGEIELKPISPNANPKALWRAKQRSHIWVHKPENSQHVPNSQWLAEVEAESQKVVFHAPSERLLA